MLESSFKPEAAEKSESHFSEAVHAFSEAFSIRYQTWELERHLEEDVVLSAQRNETLAGRIFAGFKKQGYKVAEIMVLLGAVGLAGCYKDEQKQIEKITPQVQKVQKSEKPAAPPAQTEVAHEEKLHLLTPQENAEILRQTGIDLEAIAKPADFDVELQIPNTAGHYILHIGQSHYAQGDESLGKEKEAHIIAAIQRNIEKVLISLSDKHITEVFNEGQTMPRYDKWANDVQRVADSIPAGPDCFAKLVEECRRMNSYGNGTDFAEDKLDLITKDIFQKRAHALRAEMQKNHTFDQNAEAALKAALEEFRPIRSLAHLGEDAIYLNGAAEKLAAEGVITTLPAETKEGNDGAFQYEQEFKEAVDAYFNADFSREGFDQKKIEALRTHYDEVKAKIDHLTFDVREDIAVAKVRAYAEATQTQGMIPLVFGQAHDLKDNVVGFNKIYPDKNFGLIRLIPHKKDLPSENNRGNQNK